MHWQGHPSQPIPIFGILGLNVPSQNPNVLIARLLCTVIHQPHRHDVINIGADNHRDLPFKAIPYPDVSGLAYILKLTDWGHTDG